VQNRIRSIATATELTVFKKVDPATIHLFQESLVGKAMDEIKLDICHSDSNPYLQLVFNNALVSEQQVLIQDDLTLEYLTFNFTGTEMRFTPYDAQHRAGSPIAVRADVTSNPSIPKKRQQLKKCGNYLCLCIFVKRPLILKLIITLLPLQAGSRLNF
jgi:type VI protein secretion system component Hcp